MKVIYSFDISPPCRAVLMTAKALSVDVCVRELNLFNGEQLKPNFLKINPLHTIPTLDDEGLIIINSHAISIYLSDKYGKNDSLYPTNVEKRSQVNQMLFFDDGIAFSLLRSIVIPIMHGNKVIPDEKKVQVKEVYDVLETFLKNKDWVADSQVTIADFHLITTVTTMNSLIPYGSEEHPNIASWIQRCEALPHYNINQKGLQDFVNATKIFLS
nr:glutathione S-transferase 2 [Holotrichia parallela]